MKLLITNPDALIDPETDEFYENLLDALIDFSNIEDQQVVVISLDNAKLKSIPDEFLKLHVNKYARAGKRLIESIMDQLKCSISDIMVLGCKQVDVALAANSKLLLLRADYAEDNNYDESIFLKQYGIPIDNGEKLRLFLEKFADIKKPWYYKLDVSATTVIYSLTNANTIYRGEDAKNLADKFRDVLKNGRKTYRDEYMMYFLVSTYAIVKEFEQVDFWAIYPSSSTAENADLGFFKEKARTSYGCRKSSPLFFRHKPAPKRHSRSTGSRVHTGSDDELNTIRLNPEYNNLRGKTVCVIDDFTNIGSSCETARALLDAVGVKKLIFITMGKFGKDYYKNEYKIIGDPYESFRFSRGKQTYLTGEFNNESDLEFIKSLGEIVK